MNGPYPTPEEHSDEHDGRGLEIQTDKPLWKIVPCTYEGCDMDLVVNVFYAPYKGKCNRHSGKSPKAIATSRLVHDSGNAEPNGALAKLLCPLCGLPLKIKAVDENVGWILLVCSDGMFSTTKDVAQGKRHCQTSVRIKPDWKSMEMTNFPTRFREFITEFNIQQDLAYFDERDQREDASKA
jgi:hypothetical protein